MDRLLGMLPGWELGTCSLKALVRVRCQAHEDHAAVLLWDGGRKLQCLDGDAGAQWDLVRTCGLAGCPISGDVLSDPSTRFEFPSPKETDTSEGSQDAKPEDSDAAGEEVTLESALEATIRAPPEGEDKAAEESVVDPGGNEPCLIQPMDWYEPRSSRRIEEAAKSPAKYPLIDFDAPQDEPVERSSTFSDLMGLEEDLLKPHAEQNLSDSLSVEGGSKEPEGIDDLIIFDDDLSDSDSDTESDSGDSDSGGSQSSQSSQSETETPPNELDKDSKEGQATTSEESGESNADSPTAEWIECDFPFADSPIPEPNVRFDFPFASFPLIELELQPEAKSLATDAGAKDENTSEDTEATSSTGVDTPATGDTSSDLGSHTQKESNPRTALSRSSTESGSKENEEQPPTEPVPEPTAEVENAETSQDSSDQGENSDKTESPAPVEEFPQCPAEERAQSLADKADPFFEDAQGANESNSPPAALPQCPSEERAQTVTGKADPLPDDHPGFDESGNLITPEGDKAKDAAESGTEAETSGENPTETPSEEKSETTTEKSETPENNGETAPEVKPEEKKDEENDEEKAKALKKEEKKKKKKAEKEKKAREQRKAEWLSRRAQAQQPQLVDTTETPSGTEENLLDLVSSPNPWQDEQYEALCSAPKAQFEIGTGPWKNDWEWWQERKERIQEEDEENKEKEAEEAAKPEGSGDDDDKDKEKEKEKEEPATPPVDQGPVPYPDGMEDLMKMVGIEAVKETFLNLVSLVTVSKSTTMTMTKERLGAVFTGNPGTGKTTAARLYGQFLASLGMVSGKAFEETSGEWLYAYGVKECKRLIDIVIEGGGGVLFIDEAYPMAEHTHCPELNYILSRAEELAGKVVFVFAGYGKQMERFTTRNPGFASRIPIRFNFADFKDAELHHLLVKELKEKFGDDMAVEGGWQGRYLRVVARRIGRGRGKHGFGNAREVQNMASVIGRRYARRVFGHMRDEAIERDEWRTLPIGAKQKVLVAEDLVGPEPSKAFMQSEAWKKLSAMVGLESVKRALRSLVVRLQTNYERELAEEPLIASSLHKVFLGNPGTGKTTVARYYARILADMGLLTKGEVLLKDPSDFIGEYIGQSEANTRRILEAAKGNVLVIDEAYMLGPRYDGGGGKADCFKTAVIDTLVAQVQATGNDDMAVLLLGYREPMQTMLNNVNPGMARRFPLASAVEFEDYSRDDLQKILRLRLSEQSLRVSKESEAVALDVLERARNRLHFGNAGEIDILLDRAKDRQQERLAEKPDSYRRTLLEPQDFDPDFNRADSAVSNVRDMFKDYVGFKPIVDRLVAYQNVARNMKRVGMDPRNDIPFTYLFRGPPGTGKTSTARQVGKVFYDMGMLATDEVIECSASELIGEYIGQTGPKTQRVFSKALGKVLIIDEAYRLNESKFGAEATSEMVNLLTKTEYQNKLIVVLAGYEQEINALMDSNPGLTSRFPVAFDFPSLKSEQCFELLLQELRNRKLSVEKAASSKKAKEDVVSQFHTLAKLPAWGNARDVQTLAKQIMMAIMSSDDFDPNLEVSGDLLGKEIRQMVTEREKSNGIHAYNFYI